MPYLGSAKGWKGLTWHSQHEIPDDLSEAAYRQLVASLLDQARGVEKGFKDLVTTALFATIGGLAGVTSLILGALLVASPFDLILNVALVALGLALPLLASAFWCTRIWSSTPQSRPGVTIVPYERGAELYRPGDPYRAPRASAPVGTKAVRVQSDFGVSSLWPALVASSVTFLGITTALWHSFWGAGVAFLVAVAVGFGFIFRSAATFFEQSVQFDPGSEGQNAPFWPGSPDDIVIEDGGDTLRWAR